MQSRHRQRLFLFYQYSTSWSGNLPFPRILIGPLADENGRDFRYALSTPSDLQACVKDWVFQLITAVYTHITANKKYWVKSDLSFSSETRLQVSVIFC